MRGLHGWQKAIPWCICLGYGSSISELGMVQNQWDPISGEVNSPPIVESILVVGLNRMFTGGTEF